MKTALYRHFDADGRLLYVGIAICAFARWRGHKERSHWLDRVAMVTIERFRERDMAKRAERLAVLHERPLHNKVLGPRKRRVRNRKGLPGTVAVIADQQPPHGGS